MAILSKEINQVEVRIKRYPEGTYFDEYIKVGDREKRDATTCERYIIPEPGVTYTIEVTLKKGYQFGKCNDVTASLRLSGSPTVIACGYIGAPQDESEYLEKDLVKDVEFTDIIQVGGRKISGARLAFRQISVGELGYIMPP